MKPVPVWRRVPGGEYGEHITRFRKQTVRVYSDRDGKLWHIDINGGEVLFKLDADNEWDALQEAAEFMRVEYP